MKCVSILVVAASYSALSIHQHDAAWIKTPPSDDPLFAQSKPVVARDLLLGTHYWGDGLGANCSLDLRPDNVFTFSWSGCMGEYNRNSGTWTQEGDMVILQPRSPNMVNNFYGVNVRLVPMVWNHQLFLVDEYEAPGFCASLDTEVRELHGMDFVKSSAGKTAEVSVPNVIPARFASFVQAEPVRAKVTKLLDNGDVVIDRGSDDRLRPGFMLCNAEGPSGELKIISVKAKSAVCRPGYVYVREELVGVGMKFTTGVRWRRPNGTASFRHAKPPQKK